MGILSVADRIWKGVPKKTFGVQNRDHAEDPCTHVTAPHVTYYISARILWKCFGRLRGGEAECQEDDEKYEGVKTEAFH